jgi:FkbM family methyltransferase
MPSAATLIAHLYARRLLPAALAGRAFWPLAAGDDRVREEVITARVRLGRRSMTLRLPLRHGGCCELLFNATPRSDHAATLREFDRLIQSAACVLDVGANVGIYTYWATLNAPPSCKVIAVEANPGLAGLVAANLVAHGAPNTEVVAAATTDTPGDLMLHVGHLDSVSSIDPEHVETHGGSSGTLVVRGTTIDAIVAERGVKPDVIKIDVEGHELATLRGARHTLREAHPAILVEIVSVNGPEMHAMLTALGYRGRRFDGHTLQPIGDPIVPHGDLYADFLYEWS